MPDQPASPPQAGPSAAAAARPLAAAAARPMWQRVLWLVAGGLSLATGIVGIFLPLLPTTPFVLLAAFCLSRGSSRAERWMLDHPRFGPMVRDWRAHHALPLRAKQLAWAMMALGSAWAAWVLPAPWAGAPALVCLGVALWLWRLPTRRAEASTRPATAPTPAPAPPPRPDQLG